MTFAGSRGRVESQLVPDAGFELDTFAISGFPRRIGLGLVRAVWQAMRAPFACWRILSRRRPDVVLGGGGYVAGPMVLAARARGIPTALTEADAHLGLANRLAAPLSRRVFLAYAIDGRDGAKYRVVGRPIPAAHLGAEREDARARFGLPQDRPVLAVFGGLAGAQALNEFAVEAFGESGPAVLHVSGARDYDAAATACRSRRLRPPRVDGRLRSGARCGRPGDLARRRHGLGARCRGYAGDPRAVPARDRRPPDAERPALRGGRRGDRRRPEASSRASRRWSRSCSPTRARLAEMSEAMRALAKPDAADVVADELVALAKGGR